MARKKKPSRKSPATPVRSFMRPEWRRKIFGDGGKRELPPRTAEEAASRKARAKTVALPAWLRPFAMWQPTPEQESERLLRRESSLAPHLVPESELKYIEEMRRGGGRANAPYRSYAPPGTAYAPPPAHGAAPGPRSRYQPPPQAARRGEPPPAAEESPASAFNLPALWGGLRQVRSDPRFRGTYGVGQLSQSGRTQAQRALDVAEFFKVPADVIERYRPEAVWNEWAEPFLKAVEEELNRAKPSDIPGRLKFDLTKDGAFGLVYLE